MVDFFKKIEDRKMQARITSKGVQVTRTAWISWNFKPSTQIQEESNSLGRLEHDFQSQILLRLKSEDFFLGTGVIEWESHWGNASGLDWFADTN